MARVELENLTRVFPGGVRAVSQVDLVIEDHEFVVLVGPSGCGKTTTLRLIAGLDEVTDGVVRIGGRVVNHLPPKDRDVAMVFQNYALYPHMTVQRNLAFGLVLRGMPKPEIHQRVASAARMLDLEPLLDRKPRALSGGQRQRVALGRAIVREPAAFLFDEPLSNLDATLRLSTRAELKRLHQRLGITTIHVTHDQEEAMTLAQRIVVMKDGRIQQSGSPLDTYNHPVNRFVAGFIGTPPMNFFDGIIRDVDGRLVFEEGRRMWTGMSTTDQNVRPAADELKLEVRANAEDGELTLPGNGFRLVVPPHLREAAEARRGRPVVLGIRPEHFRMRPVDEPGMSAQLDVRLTLIEPLGNNMDVYMDLPLHDRVVARVEAEAGLHVGSRVRVYADLRRVHLFEPGETGMNLSLTSEPAHAA